MFLRWNKAVLQTDFTCLSMLIYNWYSGCFVILLLNSNSRPLTNWHHVNWSWFRSVWSRDGAEFSCLEEGNSVIMDCYGKGPEGQFPYLRVDKLLNELIYFVTLWRVCGNVTLVMEEFTKTSSSWPGGRRVSGDLIFAGAELSCWWLLWSDQNRCRVTKLFALEDSN